MQEKLKLRLALWLRGAAVPPAQPSFASPFAAPLRERAADEQVSHWLGRVTTTSLALFFLFLMLPPVLGCIGWAYSANHLSALSFWLAAAGWKVSSPV